VTGRGRDLTVLRFLLVGGGMAGFYSALAALATTHLPWPHPVSSAAAWVVCIPLGYHLQRRITFASATPRRFALGLYAATQVIGIAIVTLASFLLARGAFWPDLAMHLAASAVAAVASYAINRAFIFPDRPAA
jgi:putative flippase GtrA